MTIDFYSIYNIFTSGSSLLRGRYCQTKITTQAFSKEHYYCTTLATKNNNPAKKN